MTFLRIVITLCWSMISSENRYPPRIKSGAGIFGIMLQLVPRQGTHGHRDQMPWREMRLRRIDLIAATVRLVVPSLRIAFLTWKSTVFSLIFMIWPMSHDDFP